MVKSNSGDIEGEDAMSGKANGGNREYDFVRDFWDIFYKSMKDMEEERERYKRYNYCTLCNLEFFEEDNIGIYWILWLDILGFSNLVMNGKYKLIYEMLSFLSNFYSEKHSHYFVESSVTCSDTCVNLLRAEKTNLVYVLEDIAILQINFIQTFHQLLRGSVVVDKVFFSSVLRAQPNFQKNNIFLFGPGIVRAAKLEQRVRIPVVGISPDLIMPVIYAYLERPEAYPVEEKRDSVLFFLFKDCPDCSDYRFIVENLLSGLLSVFLSSGSIIPLSSFVKGFKEGSIKDSDAMFFVDYLGYLLRSADIEDREKKYFVDIHKKIVESLSEQGITDKSKFLEDYQSFYKL